jgi:ABC-2 type transport system permease protein
MEHHHSRHDRARRDDAGAAIPVAARDAQEARVTAMWESLARIVALVRKELLAMLKDPRARWSVFVPPVLQCLIFGYAASYDLNNVPYAVLDQDHSIASHDLLARFDGSRIFTRVADLQRESDIAQVIDDERALLVIQTPQDFERNLLLGKPANIQIIADGRNSNTAGVASAYAGEIVDGFNAEWRSEHGLPDPPMQVTMRAWFNPNLETRWNMIPSLIGTITLIQTMMLSAMSIAREREQGTFDQLLVTPFRPMEIMAGKAVPSMIIGTLQATTILLVAQLWFQIPFQGSLLVLYPGLILFLIAAIGIGILVSSIAETMQQAMLYGFLLIMPFSLLSGLTTPVTNMPESLQIVTLANPLRYAITIAQRVYLEGVGLDVLWPNLWPMAIIATVTLGAATWMFRHRVG